MLEKGKRIAAPCSKRPKRDIAYRDGGFGVVGTDRRIALFELAARAAELKRARRDRRRPRHQGDHRDAADLPQRRAISPRSRSIPTPARMRDRRLHRGRRLRQRARRA